MNLPAKIEQLPALALDQSLKTLWLPEWLQRSVSGLTVGSEEVVRNDGAMGLMPVPTIRRSLALSSQARHSVAARIEDLQRCKAAIDVDKAMACVTELLLAFASQALSEVGARARARGYITAMEDLPVWAIAEACRRWLRADAGEQNYNFAPSPPVLRKIAERISDLAEHQIAQLNRLLAARVVDDPVEYSEEHCASMRDKLKTLLAPQVVQ